MQNVKYAPEEPICAVATALAPAALGIVRCSGKNCVELVSKVFSRPAALNKAEGNTLVYGWLVDKTSGNECLNSSEGRTASPEATSTVSDSISENRIDEVMVSVYRAPKSFTGEEMVEISCHGGPNVVLSVYNLLLKNGFRQAEKGEFTFRAFVNGKADLTKAEAVREIIDSHTGEARSRAAGRLAGNLFEEIDSIKKLITDTLAAIEVEIEYPEDEETISDTFDMAWLLEARERLSALNDSWKGEKLYQDGVRVVLCGKTNAGKSSLFNAILKEERAIVSDIEGTTRDWIESYVDIQGIPVRLFDTAGLRETEDVIEAQGVTITRNLASDADLNLYIVDGSKGLCDEDRTFLKNSKNPCVLVWNKADKSEAGVSAGEANNPEYPNVRAEVKISAKKGSGFEELYKAVGSVLKEGGATERTQVGLGSQRQKDCVQEALESVSHAIMVAEELTLDAVVQDLEDALDSLGELTGEVCADDVLESIFSHFCVGK